eukprot:TRINITY_DN14598_c0_g1_i1.p1 TRINITY_DN14598_c0_g1~~TRINITY_DN14598_c0_g1_i1.p1  ORF type:complete len:401 (+),score=104.54 TRINITY_DN14598_c0_g1_i1:125-1327(+)
MCIRDRSTGFLLIYVLMMAADWLQGPYVYRLYAYYGFSRKDNGILFIAGFGSSLVFGTWAGPLADRYGRKLNCLLYGVTYILSCSTKFFNNFWVLMLGRLLGGLSTSILWSAFESWMVSEHNSRGFDPALIGGTFSTMITLNGLIAISSGFLAQWSVDFFDHPVAPFGLSIVFLVVGMVLILNFWTENYGDQTGDVVKKMRESISIIAKDRTILMVGIQQALFEGAMYTFVFIWTPALETIEGTDAIPHGIIFACFMLASSIGSMLFGSIESFTTIPKLLFIVFCTACATMILALVSTSPFASMGAFTFFEIAVGMFWPCIGTLRSQHLPESHRATIINLFRAPLNFIVCMILYRQDTMTISSTFMFCAVFHGAAALAAFKMSSGYETPKNSHDDHVESS